MTAPRLCLYTPIHKSLRRELFQLVERVAATDVADANGLETVGFKLGKVVKRLHGHRRHEETFMHPLMRAKGIDSSHFDATHVAQDTQLAAVELLFAQVLADPTQAAMRAFAGGLNRFIAEYLTHMDEEENGMHALWPVCSDEELAAVMGRLVASQTIDELLANQEAMLPAVTPTERAGLLGALKTNLPPELFAHVRTTALRILTEDDRAKLGGLLEGEPAELF